MKTDMCDELCAAEPACRFYAIENRWKAWDGTFPRCFLFDALAHDDIIPAAEVVGVLAFWATSVAKRGALCEVCACTDDGTADCRGRDLQTVPAAGAGADATTIDLSDNPRLTLVGPGAFDGLDGLEALVLPSGVKHLAPEALESLPALRDVSLAATGDEVTRNFVDASSTARFDDVACRREIRRAGSTSVMYLRTSPASSTRYTKRRTPTISSLACSTTCGLSTISRPTLRFWLRRPNPRRSVRRIAT